MDPRSSLSEEQRVGGVDAFEQGLGDRATATLLGVPRWPVRRLYQHWQLRGREVLMSKSVRREYPQALKIAAVERFIAGEEAGEITRSLNIASRVTLGGCGVTESKALELSSRSAGADRQHRQLRLNALSARTSDFSRRLHCWENCRP